MFIYCDWTEPDQKHLKVHTNYKSTSHSFVSNLHHPVYPVQTICAVIGREAEKPAGAAGGRI